jgi:hypothetical protein
VLAGCLHTKWPEIRIILTRPGCVSRGARFIGLTMGMVLRGLS